MLSPRTSSLSKHIPPDLLFSHDAAAGLLLTLVLTHEYLLGPLGPWWDYLQSMPRQRLVQGSNGSDNRRWGVPLPIAWTPISEEWKWIAGSEAGRIVQRTRDDPVGCIEGIGMSIARLRSFFTTTALPILQNVHRSFFDDATTSEEALWDDFVGMQSLISSRSFVVDMYHGLALVPLSDMFNHLDDANVHFEADDEVCDECGSLGQCPHNDDPLPSSAYGRPSAFLPAESGPNSADWKVPPALEGVDTVDMVAQEHIGSGQEAFNTYGLMSNSVLLTTYGFCLEEETQWERYGWEWRNAGERSEIRHALGLSTSRKRTRELEGDENGEGRYAVHANEGTATKSVLERWVMACVAFSGLPASAFAELKGDPMDVIAERKADTIPGTATLTLPVMSPFIALTRSATTEGSEAADDEETDLSEDLLETIAPLSTHDGSRDRQQPLFLDAEGRISLSLWRAALLATYAETHTAAIEAKPLRLAVLEAEEVLERTIIRAESIDTDTSVRNGSAHPAQDLVLSTLKRLYTLIESRRTPLRISGAKGEADALHLIEVRTERLAKHPRFVLTHRFPVRTDLPTWPIA